jgi:mono/diheme cytochrome c family protein
MRWNLPLPGVLACVALAGLPATARAQSANGTTKTTLDGVYTSAQAARGRNTFSEICSACHTSTQFKGETFQGLWEGRTVGELFEQIRTTMPNDNPGGLSRAEYAAVVAYMLQLNEYPDGSTAVPTELPALQAIRFEVKPQAAAGAARQR